MRHLIRHQKCHQRRHSLPQLSVPFFLPSQCLSSSQCLLAPPTSVSLFSPCQCFSLFPDSASFLSPCHCFLSLSLSVLPSSPYQCLSLPVSASLPYQRDVLPSPLPMYPLGVRILAMATHSHQDLPRLSVSLMAMFSSSPVSRALHPPPLPLARPCSRPQPVPSQ